MYSDLFKTVFVHVPKTGGQSVELVFLEKHGLTWRTRSPLLLGLNHKSREPNRLCHMYASEYTGSGYLTQDVYDACFKFVIVRDPYDRLVSEWKYQNQRKSVPFRAVVDSAVNFSRARHFVPQAKFVQDKNGKMIVERIIRFESLGDDFREMSKEIFGETVELPHKNKSAHLEVPEIDQETRNALYKRYECDYDLFQYASGREYHNIPLVKDEVLEAT